MGGGIFVFFLSTRCPLYADSELGKQEDEEALAMYADDWNIAKNRKRR